MLGRVRMVGQAVAVLVVCALALPVHATAAGGSPLHVDPASPVAKAYALPLDGVRGGSPGTGNTRDLFGAGITPSAAGGHPDHRRVAPVRRIGGTGVPAAYTVLEPGTGSGLAWMATAAVVVLAIGSAAALAVRRRR